MKKKFGENAKVSDEMEVQTVIYGSERCLTYPMECC